MNINTEFTPFSSLFMSMTDKAKQDSLIEKKTQNIAANIPVDFKTVLSYGNSLVALGLANLGYKIYIVGEQIFTHANISYLDKPTDKYDIVLAIDQVTTFSNSNENQKIFVEYLCSFAEKMFITTLADYKNMNKTQKNFEEPFYIKYNREERTIISQRKWDNTDRQQWKHHYYVIDQHNNMLNFGPYIRRTMYFKQLANFLYENKALKYEVLKEPMYKGIFSKTFQNIIMAEF